MPRISFPTDPDFLSGKGDDPVNQLVDLCAKCAEWYDFEDLAMKYQNIPAQVLQEAIDELKYGGEEHPPYDDCDYVCDSCEKPLTSRDD